MKKTILFGIMSLLLTSSALALDTGANSVYIDQTNADNSTVTITQLGYANKVGDPTSIMTPQFAIDGNNMNLTIYQDGMNNSITGNFIGGDSTASISQTGSGNSTILNMGIFGSVAGQMNIGISGDNNSTTFNMATASSVDNYNYNLTITGNTNTVTSTMNSKYIQNNITIAGNGNSYTTLQNGANGTQNSPGHSITSSIIGNNNTVSLSQISTTATNSITLNVTGSGTSTTIVQH
jgi:hypothetical protein